VIPLASCRLRESVCNTGATKKTLTRAMSTP
jgi:hypothetical protein